MCVSRARILGGLGLSLLSAVPVGLAFAAYYLALASLGSWVLPVWTILLAAAVFGLVGLGIGIALRPFAERTRYRWFVVQFGLIWVAVDLLVQDNEIIGTYSWIAYRIADLPQFVQPVSLLSTPVLSLLVQVVNAAVALAVPLGDNRIRAIGRGGLV